MFWGKLSLNILGSFILLQFFLFFHALIFLSYAHAKVFDKHEKGMGDKASQ